MMNLFLSLRIKIAEFEGYCDLCSHLIAGAFYLAPIDSLRPFDPFTITCATIRIMRRILFIAIALLNSVVFAQEIEWHKNLEESTAIAKQAGLPILIDFWASWCVPCGAMRKELWESPEGKKLASKFVCVRLDFDNATSAIQKFHVNSVPTVVFADSWGNFLTKLIGFEGPKRYLYAMNMMPTNFKSIDPANEILSTNSKDIEALHTVARFYYDAGAYEFSNHFLERAINQSNSAGEKSEMMVAIGWNQLKMKDYKNAEDSFHECLKIKDFAGKDVALFGLVVSALGQNKKKDAQKAFEELRKSFPDSPATAKAARLMGVSK
jgi:tetratricopeptide (TPR) repeat protein